MDGEPLLAIYKLRDQMFLWEQINVLFCQNPIILIYLVDFYVVKEVL